MKALLATLATYLALFMMFLGTANAGLTSMDPNDVTTDWYISGNEPDIKGINPAVESLVFSPKCVESSDTTEDWYCNLTEGCPHCVKREMDLKGSMDKYVPQADQPKYFEDDFGWYS